MTSSQAELHAFDHCTTPRRALAPMPTPESCPSVQATRHAEARALLVAEGMRAEHAARVADGWRPQGIPFDPADTFAGDEMLRTVREWRAAGRCTLFAALMVEGALRLQAYTRDVRAGQRAAAAPRVLERRPAPLLAASFDPDALRDAEAQDYAELVGGA